MYLSSSSDEGTLYRTAAECSYRNQVNIPSQSGNTNWNMKSKENNKALGQISTPCIPRGPIPAPDNQASA